VTPRNGPAGASGPTALGRCCRSRMSCGGGSASPRLDCHRGSRGLGDGAVGVSTAYVGDHFIDLHPREATL
jgi:hypothetical protein